MKKQLNAAIAAAYWGCEIHTKGETYKMHGMPALFGEIHLSFAPRGNEALEVEQCQLVLTPLSAISDEDAIEVAKIIDANNLCGSGKISYEFKRVQAFNYDKGENEPVPTVQRLNTKGDSIGLLIVDFSAQHMEERKVIDYLRSSVRPDGTPKPIYDCGYLDIPSLIESGIAVDKTKME
jgi:hypothetical protein